MVQRNRCLSEASLRTVQVVLLWRHQHFSFNTAFSHADLHASMPMHLPFEGNNCGLCMFCVCVFCFCFVRVVCVLYVYGLCVVCVWSVCCMCVVCVLYVCGIYVVCVWPVCSLVPINKVSLSAPSTSLSIQFHTSSILYPCKKVTYFNLHHRRFDPVNFTLIGCF